MSNSKFLILNANNMLIQKRISVLIKCFLILCLFDSCGIQNKEKNRINLAGEWSFKIDSLDIGEKNKG